MSTDYHKGCRARQSGLTDGKNAIEFNGNKKNFPLEDIKTRIDSESLVWR